MSVLTRRESRGLFLDLFDWFDMPLSALRPFTARPIRLEDYLDDGHYVVKAELPGVDPEKDIEVTVSGGTLGIRAQRREETETKHRSEFCYGVFSRQVRLPEGADESKVTAAYGNGLLTVTVPLKEKEKEKGAARQIPVGIPGKASKN